MSRQLKANERDFYQVRGTTLERNDHCWVRLTPNLTGRQYNAVPRAWPPFSRGRNAIQECRKPQSVSWRAMRRGPAAQTLESHKARGRRHPSRFYDHQAGLHLSPTYGLIHQEGDWESQGKRNIFSRRARTIPVVFVGCDGPTTIQIRSQPQRSQPAART